MTNSRNTVLIGGLVFALSVIIAFLLAYRIEPPIGDRVLTQVLAAGPPTAEIVIVAIDEDTLAKLPYRSPVDRSFLAGLIRRIDSGKTLAIGLDLLFDQPSEPQKDAELAAAIGAAETRVVLG
ncbi:MAG: CHASE2 domain-containing protein, partial [Hyphomicrobiales bacterium]|nr:CHASE2 domain-containing protein [Hyphomicrobiales bacterium]